MVTFTDKTVGDHPKDALDALAEDHREAKELLKKALATNDKTEREEVTGQLVAELVRHSIAEETFIYPLMRNRIPNGDDEYQKDLDQHQALEETLQKLEQTDSADPKAKELLQHLEKLLDAHVEHEESYQFKQIRETVPKDQLINLNDNLQFVKASAPHHAHPGAPRSGVARFWSSPVVGTIDQIRDAFAETFRKTISDRDDNKE
jgi:hemerythrin superfamily protein